MNANSSQVTKTNPFPQPTFATPQKPTNTSFSSPFQPTINTTVFSQQPPPITFAQQPPPTTNVYNTNVSKPDFDFTPAQNTKETYKELDEKFQHNCIFLVIRILLIRAPAQICDLIK